DERMPDDRAKLVRLSRRQPADVRAELAGRGARDDRRVDPGLVLLVQLLGPFLPAVLKSDVDGRRASQILQRRRERRDGRRPPAPRPPLPRPPPPPAFHPPEP